jgi:hypothetical protein
MSQLSKQAQNSLALYKSQEPSKIKQLLQIQGRVRDELMKHFGAMDIDELALRCSLGF